MSDDEAAALDIGARQKARHYAVQALYQHILTGDSAAKIEAEFRVDYDISAVDLVYFHEVLSHVIAQTGDLDALFDQYIDRDIKELDPVSLAQLRLSTYEMQSRLDVPYLVVIEEAIRLSKKFGPTDSYKYLNGVLDRLSRDLRSAERAKG